MPREPLLALFAALLLVGCTTPSAQNGNPDGAPVAGLADSGECQNNGLDAFSGQTVTSDLGAQILRTSGARTLRWGAPGMAMTMDYRQDRVTVSYDEAMRVISARCG